MKKFSNFIGRSSQKKMDFKNHLEKLVESLKDNYDIDRCVSCKDFVRWYSAAPYYHPRLCETCIKNIYQKWEYAKKS